MSRIGNTNSLSYDTKYSIILNKGHILTELLVWDAHNRIKHLGEWQTLAEICCCYWVPRDKSFVKKILHRCLICRKFNSRPYSYANNPNLPNVKVSDKIAFYGTELVILARYIAKVFMIWIHWKMIMVYLSATLFYTHAHPQKLSF